MKFEILFLVLIAILFAVSDARLAFPLTCPGKDYLMPPRQSCSMAQGCEEGFSCVALQGETGTGFCQENFCVNDSNCQNPDDLKEMYCYKRFIRYGICCEKIRPWY